MADPEKAMLVDDSHEEVEDEEEGVTVDGKKLMMNSAVLSALQGKLDSMSGDISGYIQV